LLIDAKDWSVLLVNDQTNDIYNALKSELDFNPLPVNSIQQAKHTFNVNKKLAAIIVDYMTDSHDEILSFLQLVEKKNPRLPVILISEQEHMNDIKTDLYRVITDCIWRGESTIKTTAKRLDNMVSTYLEGLYPPFFKKLVEYTQEYKYAWHTPGHMGGEGFKKSAAGHAFFDYYGENAFLSDLSISVPELGSLLDHSGVINESECYAAKTFGSDFSYFVLNGTSSVNQIIWHARVSKGDTALVDRNCHKSLNYSMVNTDANPIYLIPRRNPRGIIGPVSLHEFSEQAIHEKIAQSKHVTSNKKVKMSALTNSTYDGICYNVKTIKSVLKNSVENLHFDEAWYAYARFHPIYKDHFAMTDSDDVTEHPPIFASHSTHKLLAAFSQSSMIHVKDGSSVKVNETAFNEAYMLHGSTSPQYSMIASLDVATHMMAQDGEQIYDDVILSSIRLRKKIAKLNAELVSDGDWFFDVWQPKNIKIDNVELLFSDTCEHILSNNQSVWTLSSDNNWHGFSNIEDNYAMLDPTKVTFTTPGLTEEGRYQAKGIPASIVTDYLIQHGIVCEKSDYYSFLLLNSIGTSESKQANLITGLLKFKALYDENAPLEQVFPALVAAHPESYQHLGLQDHCQNIHQFRLDNNVMEVFQAAFSVLPDVLDTPAEAYRKLVKGFYEPVFIDAIIGRAPAVMVVPYPPGIPVIMGGEIINEKDRGILDYLKFIEDFENTFPGYENDIHGVERELFEDKIKFKILCLTEDRVS
jgi:lysine decarboxylase/arginine decarboxylase